MRKILTLILFTVLAGVVFPQFDRDTLTSWTDSISVFNVPKKTVDIYEYIEVTIKDTTGGTAIVDSFAVEKFDYYNNDWHRIGAKNIKSWDTQYQLTPGNGQTKTWIILSFCEKANYIRVRRLNTGIEGVKSMVTWEGKGKCQ